MGKEKEAVKEALNAIIKKEPITSPQQLAKEYLKHTMNKPSELPVSFLGTKALEVFYRRLSDNPLVKEDADLRNELEEIKRNLIDTPFKEGFKKFSKETATLLRVNYGTSVIESVINALIDFSIAIDFSLTKTAVIHWKNINEFPVLMKKLYKRQIKACNELLVFSFLSLTDQEKLTIEAIKKRYENFLREIKEVSLNPVKAFELQMSSSIGALSPYNPVEWSKEHAVTLSHLIIKKEKGRPKDIFFKALQIVTHQLLTINKPIEIRRDRTWAMKLTADIINEFYKGKGLPCLKPKDIDNSLHSA